MSTASPLPLQPLPPGHVSEDEARALKRAVADRLKEHRERRGRPAEAQVESAAAPRHSVANSVAARFARSVSYSDFLKQEAEAAIRQAEAAAEVARRNAEAIAAAQQQLLDEIEQWNQPEPVAAGPAEVIAFAAPVETPSPIAVSEAVVEIAPLKDDAAILHALEAVAAVQAAQVAAEVLEEQVSSNEAHFAEVFTAAVNEIAEKPATLAERLGLATGPLEVAEALPTNLIEFPRQLVAARKVRPRLAEGPLREESDALPERAQLRIFEVEPDSVSTVPLPETGPPEWHSIRLENTAEPHAAEYPDAQISFAMPLYVAPVSLRLMAFAVDACCVLGTLFAAIAVAAYASPVLPTGIFAGIAAAVTVVVCAVGYQMLFFSLSDSTPGMRYARIGFCTFHDENPTRKALRHRITALLLAGIPLGLGLLWAAMDEEGLGWHDRISRMYPRAY